MIVWVNSPELLLFTVTDVSTTCAIVNFRVKVIIITLCDKQYRCVYWANIGF